MNRAESIVGCLIAGAIGDAFGNAFEGQSSPLFSALPSSLTLSDDTQLTVATCEAIIQRNGAVDPATIAARFAEWHRDARITGIGVSTFKALTELVIGGHWALVGRKGDHAAGNGAAMRIAPLAFCLDPQKTESRQIIRDVSRITHHHEEAYAGALAVAIAVRAAWTQRWDGTNNLLNLVIADLPDTSVRDRSQELAQLPAQVTLAEIAQQFGASGCVVESVPLALYAAQQIRSLGFERMIRELIEAGGDTDTTASMAGQITGALIGRAALPEAMIARLPQRSFIEKMATQFADTISRL